MSELAAHEEPPRRSMYIEKAAAYLVNADQHELGNAVAVEVNWSEWAAARIAQLEHEKASAGRDNSILLKDVDRLLREKEDLRERAKELEGDVGRLTEHSVMLNSIGWKVAQALEVVPPGSRMMELDVPRLVVQLIGQRDMLRDAAQDGSKHLRDLMHETRALRLLIRQTPDILREILVKEMAESVAVGFAALFGAVVNGLLTGTDPRKAAEGQ